MERWRSCIFSMVRIVAGVLVLVALVASQIPRFWIFRSAGRLEPVDVAEGQNFTRRGRCAYHWWWGGLKELGDFILTARMNSESKEFAWKRWKQEEQNQTIPVRKGLRYFNGTEARFMELWDLRQCPPGPCGPRGYPCPSEFPGFDCRANDPCCGSYCCDDAGCYHDSCDNDGCFPHYEPCHDESDDEDASTCGEPGHCQCRRWATRFYRAFLWLLPRPAPA